MDDGEGLVEKKKETGDSEESIRKTIVERQHPTKNKQKRQRISESRTKQEKIKHKGLRRQGNKGSINTTNRVFRTINTMDG